MGIRSRSWSVSSLALALVSIASPSLAATIRVDSRVSAATVFPSAVSVRRSAELQMVRGQHELVFGPLPMAITDESLRLTGVGPGLVTDATVIRIGTVGESTEASRRSLSETIAGLRAQHLSLLAERERALGSLARQRVAVGAQLAPIDQRIAAVRSQIDTNVALLSTLEAQGRAPAKYVSVEVSAERDGQARLELDYAIQGAASWRPSYAAHLAREGANHTVQLDVLASLQQTTGEDWTGVRVTLSSVQQAGHIALPTLEERAITLGPEPERDREVSEELVLRRRMTAGVARPSMAGAARATEADVAMAPVAPPTRIERRAAAVRANLLAARFEVPMPVTLRSGATPRRILAAHTELRASIEHYAAPRHSTSVFLTAKTRNENPFALLAGTAALFVEGEFVGTAAIRDTAAGDELTLPFGVDGSVSIDRTLASREARGNGGRDTTGVRYDYRVSNHREQPVDLIVFEQLPVSRSQGLVVRTSSDSRSASARQEGDAPGVLRWNVRLAAGATDRWHLGINVSAPHGREIEGEIE
ncbi:MAG: DUF4139 domain-containing protein [Myxococcales bacterium]|nr:DUF4139 domain-containing protein [Myxococcales bacterium]